MKVTKPTSRMVQHDECPLQVSEIVWGPGSVRREDASSSTGFFPRDEPQNNETMTRARMSTTRACIYHVNNEDVGKSRAIRG